MKKALVKIGSMFLVTSIILGALLAISSVGSQPESLPYRPCESPTAKPDMPWKESFDDSDLQKFCYYNDSVIYIQQELYKFGGIFNPSHIGRKIMSDGFIEEIGFTENPPNIRDTKISFDYYFPYCDGSDGCPMNECPFDPKWLPEIKNRQLVLVGDWDANFTDEAGSESFDSAIDDFLDEVVLCGCGQWCHYEYDIGEAFINDYGSSFSSRNRDLGTVGFEVANVYLTNIKIIGQEETVNVW